MGSSLSLQDSVLGRVEEKSAETKESLSPGYCLDSPKGDKTWRLQDFPMLTPLLLESSYISTPSLSHSTWLLNPAAWQEKINGSPTSPSVWIT